MVFKNNFCLEILNLAKKFNLISKSGLNSEEIEINTFFAHFNQFDTSKLKVPKNPTLNLRRNSIIQKSNLIIS